MLRDKEEILLKELLKNFRCRPGRIIIHRGSSCQNECIYCKEKKINTPPLDSSVISDIIEDARETGAEVIAFYGGEPSLYGDLPFFVRKTVNAGLKAAITTNGSSHNCNNERYIKELFENKFIRLTLSVNSVNHEMSDRIAGRDGHFMRQCRFLESVKGLITGETEFFVNITVMRDNYRELPSIFSFLNNYDFIKDIFLLPVKSVPERFLTVDMIEDYKINIVAELLEMGKKTGAKKYKNFFRDVSNLFGTSHKDSIKASQGLYSHGNLKDICAASAGEIFIASDNKNPGEIRYYPCCRSYLAGISLFNRSFNYSEMNLKKFMEYFNPSVHGIRPEKHIFCRTECNKYISDFNSRFTELFRHNIS
ncbi:MAG: radical SAM protein [Candidatus Eremiobacterota bacterium]